MTLWLTSQLVSTSDRQGRVSFTFFVASQYQAKSSQSRMGTLVLWPLVEQLSVSGRIVLPMKMNDGQRLIKLKNTKSGLVKKIIEEVVFVPMLDGIESDE